MRAADAFHVPPDKPLLWAWPVHCALESVVVAGRGCRGAARGGRVVAASSGAEPVAAGFLQVLGGVGEGRGITSN